VLTPTEFGNYIGADLESGDEDDDIDIAPSTSGPGPSTQAASYAPLEGLEEDDEAMEDEDMGMEMTLHGVDGQYRLS
jgi:U5 small nuclear ribonucleoprotein component